MPLSWLVCAVLGLLLFAQSKGEAFPTSQDVPYVWETKYFEQQVDHFGFDENRTYQQRYLVNTQHYKKGGPIFFYTGNEDNIEEFANNTGFMLEIAPEFGAVVIFAEHRYYGKSKPLGDVSTWTSEDLNYLTSEQALADYAVLGLHLKAKYSAKKMIAFGGSYGGMLTAWFRMKYPHVVDGGIAASAPIFLTETDCSAPNAVVTKVFDDVSPVCSAGFRQMFARLPTIRKTMGNYKFMVHLKLCNVKMCDNFILWLQIITYYLAMVNYPYPTTFMGPLPAWPVKEACKFFAKENLTDVELLVSMYNLSQFYQNFDGQEKCINTYSSTNGKMEMFQYMYQYCTELISPLCSNPKTDFFPPMAWNLTERAKLCEKAFNIQPRSHWLATQYGSRKSMTSFSGHSNIAFSNGMLDPWSVAGVLESHNPSVVVILIEDAAHHLDLRHSNPADPASVTAARKMHRILIRSWIDQE